MYCNMLSLVYYTTTISSCIFHILTAATEKFMPYSITGAHHLVSLFGPFFRLHKLILPALLWFPEAGGCGSQWRISVRSVNYPQKHQKK